jgi:hypothetical protein
MAGLSLFCDWRRLGLVPELVIQRVDDFAGARVVEAGAGLVLDGVGIALQMVNVVLHAGVLVLQLLDLFLQLLVFDALLFVCGDPVLADHDVVSQKDGEHYRCRCGDAAAHAVGVSGGADEVRVLCKLYHYVLCA